MSWLENVSLSDIERGYHYDAGVNSMLIQIVDPDMDFPKPKCKFKDVRKFKFLDVEEFSSDSITKSDAEHIARALQHALDKNMNVIVHCHAGICRSGAVAEVGVIMGFQDTETHRNPNLLVKKMLMQELGLYYLK